MSRLEKFRRKRTLVDEASVITSVVSSDGGDAVSDNARSASNYGSSRTAVDESKYLETEAIATDAGDDEDFDIEWNIEELEAIDQDIEEYYRQQQLQNESNNDNNAASSPNQVDQLALTDDDLSILASSSLVTPSSNPSSALDPLLTCIECGTLQYSTAFYRAFNVAVCSNCQFLHKDRYRLLPKTTTKNDYLLSDNDLTNVPFLLRPNPRVKQLREKQRKPGENFAPSSSSFAWQDPKQKNKSRIFHTSTSLTSSTARSSAPLLTLKQAQASAQTGIIPGSIFSSSFSASSSSSSFANMKLYRWEDIEKIVKQKYGRVESVEELKQQRLITKMNRQVAKKRKEEAREKSVKNFIPSVSLPSKHVHLFIDDAKSPGFQICKDCGFQIEYEEL